MTGTTQNNLNDLMDLLNVSSGILLYNSQIEDVIRKQGGTVAYSYNNLIMASEISENLYNELKKNPNIDYIESLPLKKYGEIDYKLIDQVGSGVTAAVSGHTQSSNIGVAPLLMNLDWNLSAVTNELFTYKFLSSGTTPMSYEFIIPTNYKGNIGIMNANILTGISYKPGIYDIDITVSNDYGLDTKQLTLSVIEYVEITNSNLTVYTKLNSQFSYTIESSGSLPKSYIVTGLPSGLTSTDNIIEGSIITQGNYNVSITVSGITNFDTKILTINCGNAPVITSASEISNEQYSDLYYYITSDPSDDVSYSVIGSLPSGVILGWNEDKTKFNRIYGVPSVSGQFNVKLKVVNGFGESAKDLKITIYAMGT